MAQIYHALIVDDEEIARFDLKFMLKEYDQLEIVAEADCLQKAAQAVNEHCPDIIFLDIQLLNESGFDLLPHVTPEMKIVFVTAYDQYAIRAFDVNALDYLLKPVNPKRLSQTMARLFLSENSKNIVASKLDYADRVFIKTDRVVKLVPLSSIVTITSNGNYSMLVHDDQTEMMVLKTMKDWESLLPSSHFYRIHRSVIVNHTYIDRIESCSINSYQIHLKTSDEPLPLSRRYAKKLKDQLHI